MRFISVVLLVILTWGCSSTQKTQTPKDDGQIEFVIIQMNDVYEIAPLGGGKYGGLARVAHLKDSLSAINPNTFLVMAGDFLNPSLIGTLKLDGQRIYGKQMVETLNAMGLDLATFGNHEFDIGREALQARINESEFAWTSGNVMEVNEDRKTYFNKNRNIGNVALKPYYIWSMKDADGTTLNVGFASSCIDSNPKDFVSYEPVFSTLESDLTELIPQSDIQLGLTHLTVEQDTEVANRFPALRLIMGGHEHNNMSVPTNNATVVKADANAKTVYVHRFLYNKATDALIIDSELVPIDDTMPNQAATQAVVDKWDAILQSKLKEVVADPNEIIYTATTPLDGTDSASRGIQTNLGGIITEAMAVAFDKPAQAAMVNGGSIRIDDQLSGNVSSLDIFRVLPFGGHIVKVDMTGALLIKTLNYGLEKRGKGAYLQRFNIDRNARGEWMLGPSEIDPEGVYSIALSDFLLKGYDIPFLTAEHPEVLGVYTPSADEKAGDIRRAVIEFLKG
ncbi:bifunctional metallophosphatase/5'-nucleotidase [Gilvibacter sediminis]|uniref:bifunctional metallophosphatase/5'-nucleotidase n=1 Tax=Gilvibacter sediminis TaxID=379071 RepID=UPI0023507010|nr:bifunctional metallophosphatase/5'-nucleotidase [Gilvibacter sediminis]MDC7999216.1 bifunctional metallophosphatase/5'-nucleotidase [Gilvibacter sediminis]